MTKFAGFYIVLVWNPKKPQESLQKRHLCSTLWGLQWPVLSLWFHRSLPRHSPCHETPAAPLKLIPDLSKIWIRLINLRQVLSWWWIKVQSEYFLLLEFIIESPEFPKQTNSSWVINYLHISSWCHKPSINGYQSSKRHLIRDHYSWNFGGGYILLI